MKADGISGMITCFEKNNNDSEDFIKMFSSMLNLI